MDLSSWKIESIFQIGLSNPKRNHFFFFFLGGGGGDLDTGRVPKKLPKNVYREKSICESSLISWVIIVQRIFPLRVYCWYRTFLKPFEIYWCPNKQTSAETMLQNGRNRKQSILLAGQSVNPGEGRPFLFSLCLLQENVHRNARCVAMVYAAYFIWLSATQYCEPTFFFCF